jgi:hypothetical protein
VRLPIQSGLAIGRLDTITRIAFIASNPSRMRSRIFNVYQQWKLAELSKHLDYVKHSLCETGDCFLVTAHRISRELSQKAETIAQTSDHDPALRFLRSIRKNHELEELVTEIAAVGSRSQDLLWFSKLIGTQLW